jgi:hypothetical protein
MTWYDVGTTTAAFADATDPLTPALFPGGEGDLEGAVRELGSPRPHGERGQG